MEASHKDLLLCTEQNFSLSGGMRWPSKIIHNTVRSRGYKTFFMLNSVEYEILSAHKYKKYQEIWLISAQISLECYFSRS